MPSVQKTTADAIYAVADAAVKNHSVGAVPQHVDWFRQFQQLNRLAAGLKWTSSSWNEATNLDRVRQDMPPLQEKQLPSKKHQMSGWTLGGVLFSLKVTGFMMFRAIIGACAPATNLINIIITPDSIRLKDRESSA